MTLAKPIDQTDRTLARLRATVRRRRRDAARLAASTAAERALIVELHAGGMSLRALARECGVTFARIHQIVVADRAARAR